MNRYLLIFCSLYLILTACSPKNNRLNDTTTPILLTDSLKKIVSIDTVSIEDIIDELSLNGRVTFNQEKVAKVFPIFGGTIINISAEIGDYVHKGETLATIKSGEIADYEKQAKDAAQQVIIANRNLKYKQDMYNSGIASEKELLEARQEVIIAQTEEKRIKEIFSIYNLSDNALYKLKAPISGFIVNRNISPNMQIRSDQNEEIFTISRLDDVWIIADVYESDISKVSEGSSVRIETLAYPGKKFSGTIDKIYHMLNEDSKTMNIRIKLKNKDYLLKPGMFANVNVKCKTSKQSMPRIDSHALVFDSEKNYVIVVDNKNSLHIREVEIFKQLPKECYIKCGIQEGEKIINKNVLLVYNSLNAN